MESKQRSCLPYPETNSKFIIDLNENYKTISLLEENMDKNPTYLGFGNDILDITKPQFIKEKAYAGLHKIQNFCSMVLPLIGKYINNCDTFIQWNTIQW